MIDYQQRFGFFGANILQRRGVVYRENRFGLSHSDQSGDTGGQRGQRTGAARARIFGLGYAVAGRDRGRPDALRLQRDGEGERPALRPDRSGTEPLCEALRTRYSLKR